MSQNNSAAGPNEGGFTLVEVLVALVILAVGVVALVTTLTTTVMTSHQHRQQASAQGVLLSALEWVKQATYSNCASAYAAGSNVALPAGWAASTVSTSVLYWNGTSFQSTCHDNDTVDLGDGNGPVPLVVLRMQQVTVTVKAPDGSDTESAQVVKSDKNH